MAVLCSIIILHLHHSSSNLWLKTDNQALLLFTHETQEVCLEVPNFITSAHIDFGNDPKYINT